MFRNKELNIFKIPRVIYQAYTYTQAFAENSHMHEILSNIFSNYGWKNKKAEQVLYANSHIYQEVLENKFQR